MKYIFVTLVIFYFYTTKVENVKIELVLENMTQCDQPQPPYSHKKTVVLEFKITKSKGKHLVSGRNTVLAEVPFRNLSINGYTIDQFGKTERWWHMEKISCRNFFGRIFLAFGLFQYNKADCVLQKGSAAFKDLDVEKLSHKVPLQRVEGRLLYHVQLVEDGFTVLCVDVMITNKAVK